MNNRKIKFRVCYTAQNGSKTIHHDDTKLLIGLSGEVYENYGKDWKSPVWEVPFDVSEAPILQQYTGFHDKTGKEIYEGDILDRGDIYYAYHMVVEWKDGYWYPMVRSNSSGLVVMTDIYMKIIGNIFENPELVSQ